MADPLAIIDAATDARLQRLEASLADLDRRLCALEARALEPAPREGTPVLEGGVGTGAGPSVTYRPERFDAVGLLSALGRTFMVFGGAYLLRALTDSGRLPGAMGVVLGLAYAVLWLGAADRAAQAGRPVSAVFHGLATVLIGFPLLWEATARFQFLDAPAGAVALGILTAVTMAVAWRRRLQPVAGLAAMSAMATALVLISGTGEVAPFAVFLVLLGIATLWLGYDRDWFWMRWPAALAADLVVIGLVARAARPEPMEPSEVAIGVALFLLASYLGSFATRTLVRGRVVIPFEVVQTLAALVVGLGGAIVVARASGVGEAMLGIASACLGLGSYAVAFSFVERRQGLGVNFYFYATLALALTLVGAGTLLPLGAFSVVAAALAVLTTWLAHRLARHALALHGAVYAMAAATSSGLLAWATNALVGTLAADATALQLSAWVVLAAPFLCMAIDRPAHAGSPRSVTSIPRLVIALVLVISAGGTIVASFAPVVAGSPPDPGVTATLRTAVIAVSALVLALATRYDRVIELGWLLYPVLFLGAVKLLVEDFRHSRPATLFLALALYGAALVAAPRLVKRDVKA